jgi:predicted phosphodiesterase
MRYGIITDVHANNRALTAVFESAKSMKIKSWWFLGDAVGYGPFPLETIRILKEKVLNTQWRIGNHDAMLVGLSSLEKAQPNAKWTIERHRELLQQDDELWRWCLQNWSNEKIRALDKYFPNKYFPKLHVMFVHASLEIFSKENQIELYLLPWPGANVDYRDATFKKMSSFKKSGMTNLLVYGHTHLPCAMGIRKKNKNIEYLPIHYDAKLPIHLNEFDALLINPGSVGLPRNPDPESHAAYGVLDTCEQTFQFCRVRYKKVEEVIYEMYQKGYPEDYRLFLQGANAKNPLHSRPKKVWEWLEWNRRYKWNGNGWDVISQD